MTASTPDRSHRALPLGPVSEDERSVVLDALRGTAIFGMLLANILIFALPAASRGLMDQTAAPAEVAVSLFQGLFVEGKFYTLFAVLFGMGLAIQNRRARDRGVPFSGMAVRRLVILLLFGLVHGLLLFSADILAFYAIVGLVALPLRNLRPRALLTMAIAAYAIGLLLLGAYAIGDPAGALPSEPDWGELIEAREGSNDAGTGNSPGPHDASSRVVGMTLLPLVTGRHRDSEIEVYRFMADEERVFGSGGWSEMIRHRAVIYLGVNMPLRSIFTSLRTLALFLLGMYLVSRGLFLRVDANTRPYKRIFSYGLVIGVVLHFIGGATQTQTAGNPVVLGVFLVTLFSGIPALSLGYAGGVALLCRGGNPSAVVRPLVATGRAALTNYVGQSFICGMIFYSFGLGLFGQLSTAQALLLAVPIFALQASLSMLWFRHFRFGPLEWLWRSLSYWRIQPLTRPSPRPRIRSDPRRPS